MLKRVTEVLCVVSGLSPLADKRKNEIQVSRSPVLVSFPLEVYKLTHFSPTCLKWMELEFKLLVCGMLGFLLENMAGKNYWLFLSNIWKLWEGNPGSVIQFIEFGASTQTVNILVSLQLLSPTNCIYLIFRICFFQNSWIGYKIDREIF